MASQYSSHKDSESKNIKLLHLLSKDLLQNVPNYAPEIVCICGTSMQRLTPIQLSDSILCDICKNPKPMKKLYNCDNAKAHPNGYNICERCAALQLCTVTDRNDDLDIIKNNGEMLELTFKWLNLKYALRKHERNWEPRNKKIFTYLFSQYQNINNIYLSNDDIRWLNVHKSVLRKYISRLEKKLNYITFYNKMDMKAMQCKQKNKWQSQQIKKKNTYKTYSHNIAKYKHSKKQRMYKLKTKPSLKKKKRYLLQNQMNYCSDDDQQNKLVRLRKNIKMKQIGFPKVREGIEKVWYDPIHYSLEYLWSLKQDFLLGSSVVLIYWNSKTSVFFEVKGDLVCFSNSGQLKLGQIAYCKRREFTYKTCERNALNVTGDSYWFHINCIKSIFIVNELSALSDSQEINHKHLITDLMKIKLINYFLFVCSFKTEANILNGALSVNDSPIQYLTKKDLNATHKQELKGINDMQIIKCPFAIQMSSQFIKGKKQNDFDYLEKMDSRKYFDHQQILTLLCSYKDSLVAYIEMKQNKKEKILNGRNKGKLGYMDWDSGNIKKQIRTVKKENRTV